MPRPFLTARWESLVLLNYACPASLLEPLVPPGTTLDTWRGQHLISLVGFLFRDTRLLGLSIPFHRTFEEVNLRFYVRRARADGTVVRAVVFIREVVPKRAIAAIARAAYNEPYLALPMSHRLSLSTTAGGLAEYRWQYPGCTFRARRVGDRIGPNPSTGINSRIHYRALLGVYAPAEWRDAEISGRAPSLARVGPSRRDVFRTRRGPLRARLRRSPGGTSPVNIRRGGIRGHRALRPPARVAGCGLTSKRRRRDAPGVLCDHVAAAPHNQAVQSRRASCVRNSRFAASRTRYMVMVNQANQRRRARS